jgi:P27 family predicted phage terminase small subunit
MSGNSNSGRKSLPATIHLLRGNPSKKSFSDLRVEAGAWEKIKYLPECPDELDALAQHEWNRIAADLYQIGIVNQFDQGELSVYCQAYSDWKYARRSMQHLKEAGYIDTTPSGYKQISVWMQIANRAEERMRVAGASFGFSPAARQRIQLSPAQGELFPDEQKEKAAKYF